MFDIDRFKTAAKKQSRYERFISTIRKTSYTNNIEETVAGAIHNITDEGARAFVIYGEPQSGKTQMMIGLTAKLLDTGFKIIVVLLNDNVQLLKQNLFRFQSSGLDPAARNFSEIVDPMTKLGDNEWVLFCKKNGKDLSKLIEKIDAKHQIVVIDDEADFATPNSKVNKGEKTKINALISDLLGNEGIYIGVTATPARLDLNDTFENEIERWVPFKPHPLYTGHATFFPLNIRNPGFNLVPMPDAGDNPKYLRASLLRYFAAVAYLNKKINIAEECYSILIHTSGAKVDHTGDYRVVQDTLNVLSDRNHKDFPRLCAALWEACQKRYPGDEDELTDYVLDNINRNHTVKMNSDTDKTASDYEAATNPRTLFTVAIGGNIVSRGVTFNNLLSMFFTRDTKHKIQQDTYIQRARMFGVRGRYLPHFELAIPTSLYMDWHRCFVFHKLSIESIQSTNAAPIWLEDFRISAVASASINRAVVNADSGEMSFAKFALNEAVENCIGASLPDLEKLVQLQRLIGEDCLPTFLIEYAKAMPTSGPRAIGIHPVRSAYGDPQNIENIHRPKGFLGRSQLKPFPTAAHHFAIFRNGKREARMFYKYTGNIRFLARAA